MVISSLSSLSDFGQTDPQIVREMIMVLFRNIIACVLLLLHCSAWLSTARLHPGAEVNAISALKASAATTTTASATDKTEMNGIEATDENLKKMIISRKLQVGHQCDSHVKSVSKVECKERMRKHLSDEVDGGFVAFSADYHAPRHHPPKNN